MSTKLAYLGPQMVAVVVLMQWNECICSLHWWKGAKFMINNCCWQTCIPISSTHTSWRWP